MYAIIAGWGGPDRRRAAVKFVLYTLLGSVLLLVGVFLIVVKAGTGDLIALTSGRGAALSAGTQLAAFVLIGLAFAVKSPLWPLHTWLPGRAHRGADRGFGDPRRRAAEDGHVRPAARRRRRAAGWGAALRRCARRARCRRDPGRLAGLPRADRAEAPDRLLERRPHGLRAARHRDHDGDRFHGRAGRQHRPRHHHRPAVLPGRRDQAPSAHGRAVGARPGSASAHPRCPACSASPRSRRSACPGSPDSGERRSRWSRRCVEAAACGSC